MVCYWQFLFLTECFQKAWTTDILKHELVLKMGCKNKPCTGKVGLSVNAKSVDRMSAWAFRIFSFSRTIGPAGYLNI